MFRFLAAALCLALALSADPVQADHHLVFGVVPQQSAKEIHRRWQPLADYLAKWLGRPVELRTTTDIPTFEACLAAGAYDIAYMNPYHYVAFHDRAGYQAVGRRAGPPLRGILVVAKDSPIESREDLEGTRLAFPSRAAFGASVIQRAELRSLGISFEPVFVNSHSSVYLTVGQGYFAAGGGVKRTFDAAPEEVRARLRVLYTTEGYTPHAFAILPSLADRAPEIAAALETAESEAPAALNLLQTGPLVAASDPEWNDVRDLGIDADFAGLLTAPGDVDQCRSVGN